MSTEYGFIDEDDYMQHYDGELPDYSYDEHPDDTFWDDYEPEYVDTCPECDEMTETPLVNNMCETCRSDKSYNEIRSLKRYNGESIQSWVNKHNDVLEKYGYPQEYEYCGKCHRPTSHQDMYVQLPDAMPGETEYACMACEDKKYRGDFQ